MSNDLNRVTIIGRLTRDPELKQIASGTAVCNFSIANGRKFKDKEDTSFFDCIAWGKLGELVAQYMKKGSKIGVDGRLQQRNWEDKDGKKRSTVEIVADNVQFLDSVSGQQKEPVASGQQPADNNPFSDDDVPF